MSPATPSAAAAEASTAAESTEASSSATPAEATEPATAPAAAHREWHDDRHSAASAPPSSTPPSSAASIGQDEEDDDGDDNERLEIGSPAATAGTARLLEGRDLTSDLETVLLSVLLRDGCDTHQQSRPEISLLKVREHVVAPDPPRLTRGDERSGSGSRLDLPLALRRRDHDDDARVPGCIASFSPSTNLPFTADLQGYLIAISTLQRLQRNYNDLPTGLRADLIDDPLDLRLLRSLNDSGEVVDVADGGGKLKLCESRSGGPDKDGHKETHTSLIWSKTAHNMLPGSLSQTPPSELPMNRLQVLAMLSLLMAGCSEPQLVAEASLERENAGETLVLSDLPIRLLPYDRDAIFDSLEAAFGTPQPEIPAHVREQQERAQAAQKLWRDAEARWTPLRDSLRALSGRLAQLQDGGRRGAPEYETAFAQFRTLEAEERRVNREVDAAFEAFDQIQQDMMAAADSVRLLREDWAEAAFAQYENVVAMKLRESGRAERVDTTDAAGLTRFQAPEGRWWVHTRYGLPYEELYWNVPLEISSDSTYIKLDRSNAELRSIL